MIHYHSMGQFKANMCSNATLACYNLHIECGTKICWFKRLIIGNT